MNIDKKFILNNAKKILETPSPSGYCHNVIKDVKEIVEDLGYAFTTSQKGNGIIFIPGATDYVLGLSAHVDTLGAMVSSITDKGTLKFSRIGGPVWPSLDGEYCTIHTRDENFFTGTILSTSPSMHVHKDHGTKPRTPEFMEVRIDEVIKSKEDVLKLGIQVGDVISFDPKTTITDSGFIKSRFLDDKISVAAILGLLKYYKDCNITPRCTIKVIVSTYEEVGHGSASIPTDIQELLAVDMGCIGEDLSCTEYDVSICAKDSTGPYDYTITSTLMNLAKENNLDYAVDIYPYYGSDVSAAYRAGNDIRGALIGPGVHASHGMERTHYNAVENTVKLLIQYTI